MRTSVVIRMFLLACFGVVMVASAPARAQEPASAADLLAGAEQTMEDAVRAADADPVLAQDLYAEAAARYDRLIQTHAIDSVELHRAAGNAHLLAGSPGRAIASYLRAERLDPTDERTRASLAHARSRVATAVAPGVHERSMSAVFWWRGRVPRGVMFGVAAGAFLAFWGVAFARLLTDVRIGRVWSVLLALVAVVAFGSLVAEREVTRTVRRGVVVDASAVARAGPSEAVYPESFEQRLSPGVEVVVLTHQDGWVQIRLADGREAWIVDSALEIV
ncbi:MAG: hypothetical protein DHS20C14_02520 [Phycisphaeraceae bacterium]|nr:MAG: hypothetical protein DHS20C14_02520 [Phycisphaeraceae bacterium]